MKENESFLFLGQMPLFNELLDEVLSLTDEEWTKYDDRKKTRGAASAKTDTIPLIYDLKHRIDSGILHENYERFSAYVDEAILATKQYLGEVKAKQAMLTRLKAGAAIPRHKDEGPLTAKTHRIHVPVITNTECVFTVGSESKSLEAGHIWVIDNVNRYHSVENKGTASRVHLIIDAF
jgi:hypothetical protein